MNQPRLLTALLAALALLTAAAPLAAQSEEEARQEALRKAVEARKAATEGAQPGAEQKPADGEKKDGSKPGEKPGEKEDKKEPEAPKVITRPEAEKGASVDLSVLREQVGRDGMVRFNLEGVPWPDLLRWLADASSLSLDWQTLPADTLNLRTQRPYSIEEARDVVNRHLLSRGFTMLRHGELLSVVKIDTLNPGLVPRVRPEELDERMPHEFVKVSFPLEWLIAERAVEELKPMLSPNGKLTALSSTNRLEAVDAVVNLREIRTVLNEEQTDDDDNRVVEIFRLQHVPAAEAVALVEQILGLESNRPMSGNVDDNTGRMIMQQLQQLQQMQRNAQQNSGGSKGSSSGENEKPKLIVNERDNAIVAHAPPDKMEIIRQTITALDTPAGRQGRATHMKIFRLSTLDPVPLVTILKELGDFSPNTKIQADETNNSLIVQGSLVDLNSVWELVQELDGSTRNFEVLPLRRLAADEVAGTIQYLMGSEEEDDSNSNSGYFSYYSYRSGRGDREQKEEKRPFKVDADIENNRLLLWANEVELEEVQNLLVKMGEIPAGSGSDETLRVIDLSSDEDAEQVLERIRQMWPNMAPNQLQIQPAPRQPRPEADTAPSGAAPPPVDRDKDDAAGIRTTDGGVDPSHPLLAADAEHPVAFLEADQVGDSDDAEAGSATDSAGELEPDVDSGATPPPVAQRTLPQPPTEQAEGAAPPITIQRGPDGRLIISSPDTRALDQLEAMMAEIAPPRRDYHIFHIKYPQTWVYGIELNLKDFFKDDLEGGEPTLDWYGGIVNRRDDSPSRLSKRRTLKIISDVDSRTILVQGATTSQLATISDLIEIYDQPVSNDPQAMRTTKFFKMQYTNAETIADTLKSVYRDLLSTNDPALRDPNGNKEERPQQSGTTLTYVYNRGNTGEEDAAGEEPSRITFEGLISVGVDPVSNTLVVSAIEGLMPEITEIVETLDEAARPAGNFHVISIDPSISPAAVQERLQKLLQTQRPQQPGENGQNNNQPGGEANNNGNGRGNRNGNGGFGGPGR